MPHLSECEYAEIEIENTTGFFVKYDLKVKKVYFRLLVMYKNTVTESTLAILKLLAFLVILRPMSYALSERV